MGTWQSLAASIYYTGVGVVLLGTGVKFLYGIIRDYDSNSVFVRELKSVHLANIYKALADIAEKLDIKLDIHPKL